MSIFNIFKFWVVRVLIPGLLAGMLISCDDNTDLNQYIKSVKTRPGKFIEPIPKFAPLPKFKFPDNDARRSPFKSIDSAKRQDEFAPDKNRLKQPLEAFPLDALKFVGTLKEGSLIWGLIKLPDGKINKVRIGDYMGENYGRIMRIKENTITLEEAINESGKWSKKTTTINLDVGR